MEAAQIVDHLFAEPTRAGEPCEVVFGEAQVLEIIERRLLSGGDQEITGFGNVADEKLEHRRACDAMLQIRLEHVELVEVRQKAAIPTFHRRYSPPARLAYHSDPRGLNPP